MILIKMSMRNIALVIGGLFFSLMGWGQGELSVCAGGGMNTILTHPTMDQPLGDGSLSQADALKAPGFMLSSRFLYFFGSGHLGFGSGADMIQYRSKMNLNGRMVTPSYDDVNGQSFDLIQAYEGWQEKQRIFAFEFPLGIYYKANFSDKTNLVCGLGGKWVVPAFSRYQITEGTYSVSGYYPQTDAVIEDLPHHGFVVTSPVAYGGLNTRMAFSLYGEAGLNLGISDHMFFHIGLYCNYGITNIISDKKHTPDKWDDFMVDNESAFSLRITEKARLFSVGLKLGVTIPTNEEGNTQGVSQSERINRSIE